MIQKLLQVHKKHDLTQWLVHYWAQINQSKTNTKWPNVCNRVAVKVIAYIFGLYLQAVVCNMSRKYNLK